MANKQLLAVIASLIGTISLVGFLAPVPNGLEGETNTGGDEQINTEASLGASPSIEGSWVYAVRGGEDGQTACEDFTRPALYKINGNTGEVARFSSDGTYKALLAYTTPSGEEHYTNYSANWELEQGNLVLTNLVAQDAFLNEASRADRPLTFDGVNVVQIDDRRYVRCVGETSLDDGQ